ncbi:MAG TPA: EpsI family protein [Bryobacteraceae bacterium]|jgi:EpsI family protein
MNFAFLKSKPAIILTVLLLSQAVLLYSFTQKEAVPQTRPLVDMPPILGNWTKVQDGVIDQDTLNVLQSDDIINREFVNQNGQHANLFVAMFRSQRNGKAPHSPKNCLPGAGWVQQTTNTIHIAVPGFATPVEANRYVVAKGDFKAVVIYWYQSRERSVASEYWAKYYVIEDAIRYNRTDTSIIKVTTFVGPGGVEQADALGEDLVKASFPTLRAYLPK